MSTEIIDKQLQPVGTGVEKIKYWEQCVERVKRAKREVNSGETDLANATISVGNWLVPNDANVGEVFHIAVGNGWLQVKKLENRDFEVSWRTVPTRR